ncbi:MAG: hypothetical protein RLZZ373_3200 [Pseudomonadota bacterium]|jgi:hypothetical protein
MMLQLHPTAAAYAAICIALAGIALYRAHIAGPEMCPWLRLAHMVPGWIAFLGLSRVVLTQGAEIGPFDIVAILLVLAGEAARMLARRARNTGAEA